MKSTLRQWLLLLAFLIVYGVVVFAATRAYYLDTPAGTPAAAAAARTAVNGDGGVARPLSDDPAALGEQADRFLTERDYPNAIAAFRKLVELEPDNVEVYNDLGLSLHYGGRSGEALIALQKGILVQADHPRIWLTRGFVEYQLGELEAAKQSLQRSVELAPDSAIADEARRFLERLP